VRFELVMGVVEVSLDGGVLDGPVHAFDLPVGPGMVGLGEAVFDSTKETEPVEGMATKACGGSLAVLGKVGELDTVVGEHGVDAVRNGFDERFEEGCGSPHVGFFDEFDHCELRGPVDSHEQVELTFGGSHLGQVDVEETDRIGVELLPLGHIAFDIGQPADAVTLQTPMKGRASELRDRSLQSVETVVEG